MYDGVIIKPAQLPTILYGLPSVASILAGLGGINLALGVRGVNLTWTDPRKMEVEEALFGASMARIASGSQKVERLRPILA